MYIYTDRRLKHIYIYVYIDRRLKHYSDAFIDFVKTMRVSLCVFCVAVCCSTLQCVAARCSVLQHVAVYCSTLQCLAARCSVLQHVAVSCSVLCLAWWSEQMRHFWGGTSTRNGYNSYNSCASGDIFWIIGSFAIH